MTIASTQDAAAVPWSLFAPGSQKSAAPEPPRRAPSLPAAAPDDPRFLDKIGQDRPRGAPPPGHSEAAGIAADDDFFGEDGFTFHDFLDIINPLQHIPVVSTIYRDLTGDDISQGSRLAGGTLFGGPIGLGAAIVNNAMEAQTGKDLGETALAFLLGEDEPAADLPQFADAAAANTATAATPAQPPVDPGRPTVEQLAALAPAAGGAGASPFLMSGDRPIPLATGTRPAGGIAATGFVTPAPAGVSKQMPLPQPTAQAQTFHVGPDGRVVQPTAPAQPVASPQPPAPAQPAAPSGPAQLSPSAAQRLMEMAQQTGPARPAPAAVASAPAASATASAAAASQVVGAQAPVADAAPLPPTPEAIPEAMLSALRKYEEMQRNPG